MTAQFIFYTVYWGVAPAWLWADWALQAGLRGC